MRGPHEIGYHKNAMKGGKRLNRFDRRPYAKTWHKKSKRK